MGTTLLQNLMAGTGSTSQLIGGLVVALLYAVVGLLSAIGSILVFRRVFQGYWEQFFWSSFLVVIAAFYLSFAAYFGALADTWQTELGFVAVILVCCCDWVVLPTRHRVWLCPAWPLGYSAWSVRLFAIGTADDGNSPGLWHVLFDVRFHGCELSHGK